MATFKESGRYRLPSVPVPAEYRSGGVNLRDGYSVRPADFRLRHPDELDTRDQVSDGDLVPIKLFPRGLANITLPDPQTVPMGAELEFTVISTESGLPVSLYGRDSASRDNGHVSIRAVENRWLLDDLKLTPEGLKFQGEIGITPAATREEGERNLISALKPVVEAAVKHKLGLLPVGLSGYRIRPLWENISPHPYIGSIMDHSLHGTALDFDSCSFQSHVGLEAYGSSAEHALAVGNAYNALLATLIYALSASAPFRNGEITPFRSNREAARNRLATRGGVQDEIPVDAGLHLRLGDNLVRRGIIPVPERAGSFRDTPGNGSHKDFRPKYSTGTAEFGSADQHPNPDFWLAQMLLTRSFVYRFTRSLAAGESLPVVLTDNTMSAKVANRQSVSRHGLDTELLTPGGRVTVREAWTGMLQWLKPPDPDDDWEFVSQTVRIMMEPPPVRIEDYFDPSSKSYLRGNFAEVMVRHAQTVPGEPPEKIASTNRAIAAGFLGEIARRIESNSDKIPG